MAVADIAAIAVWLGHVVSADLVQAYRGADVGSNRPTDIELRRMPHHLINVVDPPVILVIVIVKDVVIRTIRYSIHEEKYSKYVYFAYICRNS